MGFTTFSFNVLMFSSFLISSMKYSLNSVPSLDRIIFYLEKRKILIRLTGFCVFFKTKKNFIFLNESY